MARAGVLRVVRPRAPNPVAFRTGKSLWSAIQPLPRLPEVRAQVEAWIDHLNRYNAIAGRYLLRVRYPAYSRAFARALVDVNRARLGGHEFWIANFREGNGREFPTVGAANRRIRTLLAEQITEPERASLKNRRFLAECRIPDDSKEIVRQLLARGNWSLDQARAAARACFRCEYCGIDLIADLWCYKLWQLEHIVVVMDLPPASAPGADGGEGAMVAAVPWAIRWATAFSRLSTRPARDWKSANAPVGTVVVEHLEKTPTEN